MRTMSGHLIYTEVKSLELKKYQAPTSIGEQIENLRSLGLIINNDEEAGDFLNDVSYFRLIKAYSIGLKKKNGKYNPDVTFDKYPNVKKQLMGFPENWKSLLK